MHGKSKRRTWRKLHLGVDEQSGGIVAAVLSGNNVSDGEVLPQLLDQVEEPISQLSGDCHFQLSFLFFLSLLQNLITGALVVASIAAEL